MSNELNLLKALCDALGFEVATSIDYSPVGWVGTPDAPPGMRIGVNNDGSYKRNAMGDYAVIQANPSVEYKINKES